MRQYVSKSRRRAHSMNSSTLVSDDRKKSVAMTAPHFASVAWAASKSKRCSSADTKSRICEGVWRGTAAHTKRGRGEAGATGDRRRVSAEWRA